MIRLWLFAVGVALSLRSAQGGAVVEFQIVSYSSNGRDSGGSCCDLVFGICDCCCDLYFSFCIDSLQGNTSPENCAYVIKRTSHFHDANSITFDETNINGVPNPFNHTFQSWPGGVKFKSRVKDADSVNSDDNVDTFVQDWSSNPSPAYEGRTVHERTLQGRRSSNPTSLKVQISAFCLLNFYGPNCEVFCEGQDNRAGHYTCDPSTGDKICLPGWESPADNCLILSDDCLCSPCLHGGQCEDGDQAYTCRCAQGYTGIQCESEIDDCLSLPCANGASCHDALNSFSCICPAGYVGVTCADHMCDTMVQCQNGGTCVNHGDCDCTPEFTGARCETHICATITCQNGGTCGAGGSCTCPLGFTGSLCDVNICDLHVCHNGGTCQFGRCACVPGWTGPHCEMSVNECQSDPCSNKGTCRDGHLGYTCQCLPQYTGLHCETTLSSNDTVIIIDDQPFSQDPDTGASTSQEEDTTGLIAGLIGGIFLAILIVIIAIALVYRHRKNRKNAGTDRDNSTANFDNPLYHETSPPVGAGMADVTPVPVPVGTPIKKAPPTVASGALYPAIDDENPYDNIGPGHLSRTIPEPMKPALPMRPPVYDTPKSRPDNTVYDNPPIRYPPNFLQATADKPPLEENAYSEPIPRKSAP